MQGKVIRIRDVYFDGEKGTYGALITVAAAAGPIEREFAVNGHRCWDAPDIIAATKTQATGGSRAR